MAHSHDLAAAALVLGSLALLATAGSAVFDVLAGLLRVYLGGDGWMSWCNAGAGNDWANDQWQGLIPVLARLLLPLLAGSTLLCLAVHLAQTRLLYRPSRVLPDFSRVSPIAGWQRVWSSESLVQVTLGLIKIAVLLTVATANLWNQRQQLAALTAHDLPAAAQRVWEICLGMGIQLGVAMLALAVVDYLWKRWKLERELRMTPEEMREEMRQMQGDPQVASRRRQLARGTKPSGSPASAGPLQVGPIDPAG